MDTTAQRTAFVRWKPGFKATPIGQAQRFQFDAWRLVSRKHRGYVSSHLTWKQQHGVPLGNFTTAVSGHRGPGTTKGCTSMRQLVLPFVATCLSLAQHCLLLPCWIQANQCVHMSRSQMQSMLALRVSVWCNKRSMFKVYRFMLFDTSIHISKLQQVLNTWLSICACEFVDPQIGDQKRDANHSFEASNPKWLKIMLGFHNLMMVCCTLCIESQNRWKIPNRFQTSTKNSGVSLLI